jgi:hypothetical protein
VRKHLPLIAPTIFLISLIGTPTAEVLIFPHSNGAIGMTLGFFGGICLWLFAEHYIGKISGERPPLRRR